MSSLQSRFALDSGSGERIVSLEAYLTPQAVERAEHEANRWIKSLRLARIDGVRLRERFTYRGDSLWWFAELYLHKERIIADIFQTIEALEAMMARERPLRMRGIALDRVCRLLVPQVAKRCQLRCSIPRRQFPREIPRWLTIRARSALYQALLLANEYRLNRSAGDGTSRRARIAVFVHAAFWRALTGSSDAARPSAEGEHYLGPILRELAHREPNQIQVVGVGPRTNFRRRTWAQRLLEFRRSQHRPLPFVPIQTFLQRGQLRTSIELWRTRHEMYEALVRSTDLRNLAQIRGYQVWPLIDDELAGIAYLQFPWSARAMDEAAGAMDVIQPQTVVTYAEAGGWGRALILEARRRGIASIGVQHGFIYRHWLNYIHEPDEMLPSLSNPSDRGFPAPDVMLVDDGFAARHLVESARLGKDRVRVIGSTRLEALLQAAERSGRDGIARVRATYRVQNGQHLVVVISKFSQIGGYLPELVRAVDAMADVRLVIKCHPAETCDVYEREVGDANVAIAPASVDLGPLIHAARLVITVNSTAALEAMALDVAALAVGMPNNLTPFVEAGAIAGVFAGEEVDPALRALLYDEQRRDELARGRAAFLRTYGVTVEGSAVRAAETILTFAAQRNQMAIESTLCVH